MKKKDLNSNFYIDNKRKCPTSSLNDLNHIGDAKTFIKEILNSNRIYYYIHKIYDDSIYKYSIEYLNKSKYNPFRHIYSLLAVAKTLEDISINQRKLGLIQNINEIEIKKHLFE